eukprot:535711-Rhodomonas_salina.1
MHEVMCENEKGGECAKCEFKGLKWEFDVLTMFYRSVASSTAATAAETTSTPGLGTPCISFLVHHNVAHLSSWRNLKTCCTPGTGSDGAPAGPKLPLPRSLTCLLYTSPSPRDRG